MNSNEFFNKMEEKYTCVVGKMPNHIATQSPTTVVVMPANRYIQLCSVHGFTKINGKSYAEHILIMNTHIPEFLNNDSELRKQILATFEETPNDLQDEEFFDHYFSVCEKALDVVRDHNFEVIIY